MDERVERSVEPSLSEAETRQFMHARGVKPFSLKEWRPGTPVLYVLKEHFRHRYDKDMRALPLDKIASVARIDAPTAIRFEAGLHSLGNIVNNGGQVDFYAIDR